MRIQVKWLRRHRGSVAICRTVFLTVILFTLLVSSGCAWLDRQQRQLIYRPTPGLPAQIDGLQPGDVRYFVATAPANGQRIELWWLPHADLTAPSLLYLHGTFRTVYGNLHKIQALRRAGFSVLAVDYRGWGLSTPITPSEQTILQDAWLAWGELQQRETRASQRVIYGHSMGSGVAVALASQLQAPDDFGALILESAFPSFAAVAREAGWLARLMNLFNNEDFNSLEKISRVQAPLLMLHGNLDTTIPLVLGQQLFAAAHPPKQWCTIEGGGHSDLNQISGDAYRAAIERFRRDYLPAPQSDGKP